GELEAAESDLVPFHAAVAEHLDRAATHAWSGEGILVCPARLGRDEHAETAIAGLVRVGAREQGHHVGARGVGDPGLVAGYAVDIAIANRTGTEAAEVGAGVRLGEDRRREHFARGDLRQPLLLLRVGAAKTDQLGSDLGPGPQRADPDVGA